MQISTPTTSSPTDNSSTRFSDTCIYDADLVAVPAICLCVLFIYIKINLLKPRIKNKTVNNSDPQNHQSDIASFKVRSSMVKRPFT